jgi:catechol 2,3-dioxygenase-like lactoylglutathione lyase family enzyme
MQILEHIHLSVASIEATQRFLQLAVPEYSPRGGGFAQGDGEWLHIGTATNYIAFTEVEGAKSIENLRHIGLVVDDIDALIQRLRTGGIEPSDASALDEHPHRRRVYYCDDNGVDWEFVEYLSEDPDQRNDYSH